MSELQDRNGVDNPDVEAQLGPARTAYYRLRELYLDQALGRRAQEAYQGARLAYARITGRTEAAVEQQFLAELGPIDPVSRPPDSMGVRREQAPQ
jgi:hypothetical protein